MNLSTVKSIAIPEGNATSFSIGGVKVWGGGSSGGEPAELLSWEGVAHHIDKGDYKNVYAIGDMVPLDLGSEGLINMQIEAFDTDKLADGSGTAAISWVAKELLATKKRMNPKYTAGTDGTGTIGGWEKCELRAYLQNTIKPAIPVDVLGQIATVSKQHYAYNVDGGRFTQTTFDDVWIPSNGEVGVSSSTYEQFRDTNNRKKSFVGGTTNSDWWLRGASSTGNFDCMISTGSVSGKVSTTTKGICLGFCTGKTPT